MKQGEGKGHVPFGVVGAAGSYCGGTCLGSSMSAPALPVSGAEVDTALGCAGAGEDVVLVGGDILDVPAMSSILPFARLNILYFSSASNNVTLVWLAPGFACGDFPCFYLFLFYLNEERRGKRGGDGGLRVKCEDGKEAFPMGHFHVVVCSTRKV